jgi:hypothetical protein
MSAAASASGGSPNAAAAPSDPTTVFIGVSLRCEPDRHSLLGFEFDVGNARHRDTDTPVAHIGEPENGLLPTESNFDLSDEGVAIFDIQLDLPGRITYSDSHPHVRSLCDNEGNSTQ